MRKVRYCLASVCAGGGEGEHSEGRKGGGGGRGGVRTLGGLMGEKGGGGGRGTAERGAGGGKERERGLFNTHYSILRRRGAELR